MAYLSLYRRRRPLSFGEMTGQEHVSRTLSHALARGCLAHAYLFCGPRGTGKTTAAKILARAANCHHYPTPDPCGQCPPCRNIAAGVSLDVIEMDAASTRGIDEIRELRERTRYASSESRYKVYILDEAHMLTNEACNALLKTLEEPPPGVIFILATTDPSKLPSTVVSRCQRFDFHLLDPAQIKDCLHQVAEQEGWPAEEEALRLIARLAEGSMRDALGLLEQCRAYDDETITAEHVRSVTGVTRVELIGSLIESLASGDLENGLLVLQQVTYGGRDLALFLRDITFFFSRLLLGGSSPTTGMEESYYGFTDLLERCRGSFPRAALFEVIELLHQAGGELRNAHYPQFVMEIALIRMMRLLHQTDEPDRAAAPETARRTAPQSETAAGTPGDLAAVGVQPEGTSPGGREDTAEREDAGRDTAPYKETAACLAGDEPDRPARRALAGTAVSGPEWNRILLDVKRKAPSTHSYLKAARSPYWQGDQIVLPYPQDDFAAVRVMDSNHRRLIENTVTLIYRRSIRIKVEPIEPEEKDQAPDEHAGQERDQTAGQGEGGAVKETEGSYEFAEALKLFPGQVFDAQLKED